MVCLKHPKYKGIKFPTASCDDCYMVYGWRQGMLQASEKIRGSVPHPFSFKSKAAAKKIIPLVSIMYSVAEQIQCAANRTKWEPRKRMKL